MLNPKQYPISNIINLQVPAEPRPGERIQYTRDGRLLSGVVVGTITNEVKRYKVDGKHPVVVDYVVMPCDPRYSHLSGIVVNESDVVWQKQVKPVCGRCNGMRIIGIRGDESVDCPECGFSDEWKVF
jgi:hypothetical protein